MFVLNRSKGYCGKCTAATDIIFPYPRCSAQGTSVLLDFVSRDYSCCWPGTQWGICGKHTDGLSSCPPCGLQGNSLHTLQTAMDQKVPLCMGTNPHFTFTSRHVLSWICFMVWRYFNGFLTSFFLLDWFSLILIYRRCLPLLGKAPPIC